MHLIVLNLYLLFKNINAIYSLRCWFFKLQTIDYYLFEILKPQFFELGFSFIGFKYHYL